MITLPKRLGILLSVFIGLTSLCVGVTPFKSRGLLINTVDANFEIGFTEGTSKSFRGYMFSICAREQSNENILHSFHVEIRNSEGKILFSTSIDPVSDAGFKRISFGVHEGEQDHISIIAFYYGKRGRYGDWVNIGNYVFDIKQIIADANPIDTPDGRPVTNLDCNELQDAIQSDMGK